jgi:hypothetical protein
MYREALGLRSHPHPDRHNSLDILGLALESLFEHSQDVAHIGGNFDTSRGSQPSSTSTPRSRRLSAKCKGGRNRLYEFKTHS